MAFEFDFYLCISPHTDMMNNTTEDVGRDLALGGTLVVIDVLIIVLNSLTITGEISGSSLSLKFSLQKYFAISNKCQMCSSECLFMGCFIH